MTEYLEPADVEAFIASAGFHFKKGGRDLLLSALASPFPVFGEDVYRGLYTKAAILLISINQNHPLADGNKRLSWVVTKAFLALNGHHLAADSVRDGDEFVRSVADHTMEFIDVVDWIEMHTTRL